MKKGNGMTDDGNEVLVRIGASAGRRWIGVGALAGLGGLFLVMALGESLSAIWVAVFLLCGAGALWASVVMERATRRVLQLTRETLSEVNGEVLAEIADVTKVDRSAFAMKPSNGFVLYLGTPQPRAWRPGLWWRLGRRVAVGGVTSGGQTKPMADAIALLIAERDGKLPKV
jgi:hypothetical protein